jgi:phosphoglycolate phosphatase
MPRTLILDLDGTLVDSVPDLAAALNRLTQARGLAPFTAAEVSAMVGDGPAVLVERAFAQRMHAQDAAAVGEFMADYSESAARNSRPYPGVEATLEKLTGRAWRLAVCTNKPEAAARSLLATLGLDRFFAFIGGGDSFPVRKPNPAHVLATLRAAGGSPARALMVGDHHNDIAAAAGAGIPCIFASWGYGRAPMSAGAVAVAHRFSDLDRMAERLLAAEAA